MAVGARRMTMRGLEMGFLDLGTITRIMTALNLCIGRRETSGITGSVSGSISRRCLPAHNPYKSTSQHVCSGGSGRWINSKAIRSQWLLTVQKQYVREYSLTLTFSRGTCMQSTKYQ
jgi:hypothetical protein